VDPFCLQGAIVVQVEVEPDGTVFPDHIAVLQSLGMGLDEKDLKPEAVEVYYSYKRRRSNIGDQGALGISFVRKR